jgi:DNA-binding response OmpR family regulator
MQGRTVVVVEDEQSIAGSLAARLRAEGFRVAVAHDGPGGVELCRNVRPDVVVLDATGARRTVDSHVAGLRRKLGPGVVRTVHGVGYALQERPTPRRAL